MTEKAVINENEEYLSKDRYFYILFPVKRSIRYHMYRQNFYEFCYRGTVAVSLLLSSGAGIAIVNEMSNNVSMWLAFSVALFNAIDLVVDNRKMSTLHKQLRNEFINLELNYLAGKDSLSLKEYEEACKKRLKIELQEPPFKHYLNLQCHNEIVEGTSEDLLTKDDKKKHFKKLGFFQKLVMHFWSGDPSSSYL